VTRARLLGAAAGLVAATAVAGSGVAQADFPYAPGGNPFAPRTFHLAPGLVPNDFSETSDWKLATTPDPPTANPGTAAVNGQTDELCGIRGMSLVDAQTVQPSGSCATGAVHTAWEVTTGRPDVVIDVLDSGIEWNNAGAMTELRDKLHLNQGELPAPHHDLTSSLVAGQNCAHYRGATGGDYNRRGDYDVNRDGVFNVLDYACDARVAAVVNGASPRHDLRHGPPGMLTPEDLILAFTDRRDHDHNGFANDIAGWNFLDNNNDPFDDVQYGHGTGEAQDSSAEANNGGSLGTCPNCTFVPLRVGESFITDANRFAQAALYATDNGADVIQEALGTLNAPRFAQQAIEYAYQHGVTVIASAADEAAEHHNEPSAMADAIVVNSVTKYGAETSSPPSYLQLNGCTNFGPRIFVSVPSSSCSSEATGKSAGVAGLIYSAAENAHAAGHLAPSRDCRRASGARCLITANEVRQLMGSGDVGASAPADTGHGQADDVDFAAQPEGSCARVRVSSCTDPNRQITFAADQKGGVVGPLPHTTRYPARRGFDEFYGYGRLNAQRAVSAAGAGEIPPEAEITGADWFTQIDPGLARLAQPGVVNARGPYRCEVDVAPGVQPNNLMAPAGDFHRVEGGWCDGHTVRRGAFRGILGTINVTKLKRWFPRSDFTGNANGGQPQTSNGRPNTQPYAFTVRVVVHTARGRPMSGEDRRQLYLHRDRALLPGFPVALHSDGDSSPLLADIDGDNRNELVVATSDGWVHAYRSNGSELPGWPVHAERLPLHLGEPAYRRGGVGAGHYAAIIGALAAGDLFDDGELDVVADDNQGNVYAWNGAGHLVFHAHANRNYSGAPLAPFHTVRQGVRDRVEGGFVSAPVLARLGGASCGPPARRPGSPDRAAHESSCSGPLEVIAAGEDRHLYAWQADGRPVRGFPVLIADPDKVAAVDPVTSHITFKNVDANPGLHEDQGKLIDTPAVAEVGGKPVIFVGSNEEYPVNTGDEGPINVSPTNAFLSSPLAKLAGLPLANGRLYAVAADGARAPGGPFLPGWPVKIGIFDSGLLPDVGEGINGSPVVAPLTCPSGGSGMKVAVTPDAGPAYVLNANGSSCYGQTDGADNTLSDGFPTTAAKYDSPDMATVGYPAFGTLDGRHLSLFAPATGLIRALDLDVPEYQGGQDFIAGWDPANGETLSGFPAEVNDLQFLTGPAIGKIRAGAGQQVIGGTSSLDLAAFGAGGAAAGPGWPKLTGDWTSATPTLGSFGTLDTARGARKDVVSITRSGTLSVYTTSAGACSPSSSPRYHHDLANSGDATRDAVLPGRPWAGRIHGRRLSFRAPGGDLLCGRARRYEVVTSRRPITAANFGRARLVYVRLTPGRPGSRQHVSLPPGTLQFVAIRAVDEAGNVGLPLALGTFG
jgi:hypothetical protein